MNRARAPRRLSHEARGEALVAAAMPVVAAQGLSRFSLEEVAARGDVSRGLLYHYFPRGRADIALAVVERAGQILTSDWLIDESIPLEERLAANFRRIADHALAPTDAWRIYRRARTADRPDLSELTAHVGERVISSVSLNHLGTPTPPPLVHLSLGAFIAFAETALDAARETNAPPEAVMRMLADTLIAAIEAAQAASSR